MLAHFLGVAFFWSFFGAVSGAVAPAAASGAGFTATGFTLIRVLASIQMKPSSVLFAAAIALNEIAAIAARTRRKSPIELIPQAACHRSCCYRRGRRDERTRRMILSGQSGALLWLPGMRFAAMVGMKTTIITLSIALALGTLAACDRNANPKQSSATPSPSAPASTGSSAAPTTPANAGTPSAAEKADGANPTQGQVDPKEPAQHKDFEQKGDSAGPKSPASPK